MNNKQEKQIQEYPPVSGRLGWVNTKNNIY
jgi:hypothetical protein